MKESIWSEVNLRFELWLLGSSHALRSSTSGTTSTGAASIATAATCSGVARPTSGRRSTRICGRPAPVRHPTLASGH